MRDSQVLEEHGVKPTPAREKIFKLIREAKKPVDANQIMQSLAKHDEINRVTVFRTLSLFVKKQLVLPCEFAEGKTRYELAFLPHHHHIVCTTCGAVQDIEGCEISEVEAQLSRKFNFQINAHRLEFFGLCKKCR